MVSDVPIILITNDTVNRDKKTILTSNVGVSVLLEILFVALYNLNSMLAVIIHTSFKVVLYVACKSITLFKLSN